jgi:two-component system sensor histidine kinase KdpD
MARIEAGQLRPHKEPRHIGEVIEETLERLSPMLEGHPVETSIAAGLPIVLMDPVEIDEVLTNLLDNASKFSPQGGVVTVELAQDDASGIRLCVSDQGIGIPAEQREAIFDRFYQGQGSRHLSGLGLGLYITSEIVALHGGSIHIEEPDQGGTRFVVTLPPLNGEAAESASLAAAS